MKKRTTWKKFCSLFLVMVLCLSVLGGCGSSSSSESDSASSDADTDTQSDSDELVTVNFVSATVLESLDYAWLYAAIGMGYFEEEGIEVNLVEITDGTDPKVLASGQADFGAFNPATGMTNVEAGVTNIKAVLNVCGYNMYGIAYNLDSDITSLSDLEGETIGFLTEGADYIYNPMLQAAGVDTDTVTYINYGTSEYEALDSGQINAMGTWLSEYYMCQGMGYEWGYLSGEDVLPQISNPLWVNTDFEAENPELVEAFVRAVTKGIYFTYLYPEAVADLVLTMYPSIEVTWEGAVASIEGNLYAMLGSTAEEQAAIIEADEIGLFDMDKVDTTMQNLQSAGSVENLYAAEDYFTNDYVPGAIDYDAVAADGEAYEFTSEIYLNAQ